MNIRFLPEARAELQDDQHIVWLEQNYEVPGLRPGGYRRVNLKIFPYYVSYVVRGADMK